MTRGMTLEKGDGGIVVNVPLRLKKRAGRKEIVLPDYHSPDEPANAAQQEALVIAIARAHRWKRLLDQGTFATVTELAEAVGLDASFAARLLRLSLLAPDIVEIVLAGEEPNGLSLTALTKPMLTAWDEQRARVGVR